MIPHHSICRIRIYTIAIALLILTSAGSGANAQSKPKTLRFSGYEWEVKSGHKLGPGPNTWNPDNAYLDKSGALHLKLTHPGDHWDCSEVSLTKKLGFGIYEFQIIGRVDQLDKNVVLGLFNYPTPDIGPDETNELDIEFARWGDSSYPNGNYTVWPAVKSHSDSHTFELKLKSDKTTQRITWQKESILFQTIDGHAVNAKNEIQRWLFKPNDPNRAIPHSPEPVLINLWLFHGMVPTDNKETEIIIKRFKFTPLPEKPSKSN